MTTDTTAGPIPLIDQSLSRNRQSLSRNRAIKEESKVFNRDWFDHQACSLSQYINQGPKLQCLLKIMEDLS